VVYLIERPVIASVSASNAYWLTRVRCDKIPGGIWRQRDGSISRIYHRQHAAVNFGKRFCNCSAESFGCRGCL
jgi:hypothetical protein